MEQTWCPEKELLASLEHAVPQILGSQRPSGQFGTEPSICGDQNVVMALAAAWYLKESRFRGEEKVLNAVIRGGDALIDAQDEQGAWTFRKKDNSTWGQTLMPWTYSRWIRAFALIKEAMPTEARKRWEDALSLGFGNIAKTCLGQMHNIPTHHAMGLYCAGQVLDRDDWISQAQEFMKKVVEAQSPDGLWCEHEGPVVMYNFVYSEALGVCHALSGDESVLDALERAARFHAYYTYPDGSAVETIDGRNPYGYSIRPGNPGFSYSAVGRGHLARQHRLYLRRNQYFGADYAANMLLYATGGPMIPPPGEMDTYSHRMGERALIVRRRPWLFSLSAFVVPPPDNRWGQDRQNFATIYHDDTGLIIGGGNTKLQPLWSTFTVGDTSLLHHTPGEEDPDFRPEGPLLHVPESARILEQGTNLTLEFRYGPELTSFAIQPINDREVRLVYEATCRSGMPVEAHVTIIPRLDKPLELPGGEPISLGEQELSARLGLLRHAGFELNIPGGAPLCGPRSHTTRTAREARQP